MTTRDDIKERVERAENDMQKAWQPVSGRPDDLPPADHEYHKLRAEYYSWLDVLAKVDAGRDPMIALLLR